MKALITSLAFVLALTGCASSAVIVTTYSYGPDARHRVDVCRQGWDTAPRPTVLMLHAGSWTKGDKSGMLAECKAVAAKGFTGMTANYRLVPGTRYPGQVDDAERLIAWAKSRTTQVDPGRICMWGYSAGAFMSAWAAVKGEVNCAVLVAAPVDLTLRNALNAPLYDGLLNGFDARSASPLFAVGATTARMMIAHGTSDPVVPYSQEVALHAALQAAGVAAVLRPYSGGHLWSGVSSSTKTAVLNEIYAYLKAVLSP